VTKNRPLTHEEPSPDTYIRKTAQRDLEDLVKKKIIKAVAKSPTDPTKHYILL
jgi:hypothetical protein